MNANERTNDRGCPPDPLQVVRCAELLFAAGEISLTTFREMLRECHEALKSTPPPRPPDRKPNPLNY